MSKYIKSLVSVGLPVYNGENYLANALESLLDQTYENYEIIICDNASTDKTEDICKQFSQTDKRIKYHRNEKNLGAAPNFNKSFHLSSGEYFKWASHDDIIAKDFLFECVKILDEKYDVVLCSTQVQFIDNQGRRIRNIGKLPKRTASPFANIRFADIISTSHWCFDIFGLTRSSILAKTPLIGSYVGSDHTTLATLSLIGPFYTVPKPLFFSRDHSERSVRKFMPSFAAHWYDTAQKSKISFVHWKLFAQYLNCVYQAHISLREKTKCCFQLTRWLRTNHKFLIRDLRIAAKYMLIREQEYHQFVP